MVETVLLCFSAITMFGMIKLSNPFSMGPAISACTFRTKLQSTTSISMALDLVTGLRTEWISASICTNQIPSEAKSVLQIGTEDARIVNFVPRTVEEIITSSFEEDGEIPIGCQRQLKQQRERRGTDAVIRYVNQRCDDLKDTEDASVDVVVSLQAAAKMKENGQTWKQSIIEAARVLKPDGRFIFVEQTEIDGEKFIEVIASVADGVTNISDDGEEEMETYPTFELVGYDDVDLVIVPHIAGVVKKTKYAGLTAEEIQSKNVMDEKARIAELSINAFERGLKKRKKKKKKNQEQPEDTS